jgi:flagellin
MRISGNAGNLGMSRLKNKNSLSKTMERLSTGLKINRASDNAAGLSISEKLRSQVRGTSQAQRNTLDGLSMLRTADGAANEVSSMIQRQRELALQSRNGTMNDSDRSALNTEYQQLSEEINRTAESTSFNGQKVTNGSELGDGSAELQVGANEGDTIGISAVDFRTASLGTAGGDISTAAGAEAAVSLADTGISTLNEQRSSIGSLSNRLESTVNNLMNSEKNIQEAEALIRDMDMAEGASNLARDQILNQTSTSALSTYNDISSSNVLSLLQ